MKPQTALLTAAQINQAIAMWLLWKRGISFDGQAITTVTFNHTLSSDSYGQIVINTEGCRVVVSEPQDAIIDLDHGRIVK